MKIREVRARQILDCKARPLVEADVILEDGTAGRGAAPTGSSVGMYESFVLRDGDPCEYNGLSVHKAVKNVNEIIAPALAGVEITDQAKIDGIMTELDGTADKRVLGGNAIYSVSVAAFRAAAASERVELYEYIAGNGIRTLPVPCFNVINGGLNAGVRQAFNEFIIMPYGADDIEDAVESGVLVFQKLGDVIRDYTGSEPLVGGSYGWCAPSEDPEVCLRLILEAAEGAGRADTVGLCVDAASSGMFTPGKGYYMNGRFLSAEEMIAYAKGLTEKYNLVFIEDLLDENDWDGWELAHKEITKTLLIADDLTVSDPARIERAWRADAVDGFILKPNQVGTITEAMRAHRFAEDHGLLSITSGRSGGVVGDVVMDLAVGLQIPFIKNGCPRSGERIDKLNFLLRAKDTHPDCRMAQIGRFLRF